MDWYAVELGQGFLGLAGAHEIAGFLERLGDGGGHGGLGDLDLRQAGGQQQGGQETGGLHGLFEPVSRHSEWEKAHCEQCAFRGEVRPWISA